MASFNMQNESELFFSTVSFDEYFSNLTETMTEAPAVVKASSPMNINGILWPILFTVLIISANFLSLLAFCIEKRLRTYNNYFIMNLTILDFFCGLLLILSVIHTHIGYYPFSHGVCRVVSALQSGLLNASNLAVVVICADRHRAVYHPINHFMSRSKRKALMENSIPWIVSLVFWVLYTTIPEFIIDFDHGRHCNHWYRSKPFSTMITFAIFFYLPFAIITVLYFRIHGKVQASLGGKEVERQFRLQEANKGTSTTKFSQSDMTPAVSVSTITTDLSSDNLNRNQQIKKSDDSNTENSTKQRESATEMRKATRTLLFIVIAFVVSWLPQSIIILIFSIEPILVVPGLPRPARLFFGWMTYLNSFLNPISYALSQPLFRSTVINIFLCRRK